MPWNGHITRLCDCICSAVAAPIPSVPGTGAATAEQMQSHSLVMWPFHGIFGSGPTLDETFGPGHHPRQNADAIREYHQTFRAAFPQQAGKARRIQSARFTRLLWEGSTECLVVFPDGVGILPWMVPGTDGIGAAP
jgi:ribulose-5-phosphate 4-epimerase/fuculose-1-phosphate aldolase